MNRYDAIQGKKLTHWVCTKKFHLERFYIHPGDIITPHDGQCVMIEGKEYFGYAGLQLKDFTMYMKAIYE